MQTQVLKLSILGVHLLSGCSGNPEYLVQLVEDVSDPGEAGVAIHHLHEDAAGPPHIETGWGFVNWVSSHVQIWS